MSEIMSEIKEKKRLVFPDQARIIACILVLLVHVSALWLEREAVGSYASFFALTGNILAFTGVSLYVMISGALMLDPERKTDAAYCVRKSLKLFGLWFLWKVLYRLSDMFEFILSGTAVSWKEDFFLNVFRKPGHYHLWFLPMIALIYLMVPLIKKGCEKKENCLLYIILFSLVSVLMPTIFLFDFPFRYLLEDFYRIFDFAYFAGYLGYFILGYYILHHIDKKIPAGIGGLVCSAALITFIIACVSAGKRSLTDGTVCELFSSPFTVHNLLISVTIFIIPKLVKTPEKAAVSGKGNKYLQLLSASTLGVYLIHPFILDIIAGAGLFDIIGNVWLGMPLILLLLSLLSFAIILPVKAVYGIFRKSKSKEV